MADQLVRQDVWTLEQDQRWHPIILAYALAVRENADPTAPSPHQLGVPDRRARLVKGIRLVGAAALVLMAAAATVAVAAQPSAESPATEGATALHHAVSVLL